MERFLKMKKLEKIKIFQFIGFVQGEYDNDDKKIRKRPINYIKSFFVFISTLLLPFKLFLSIFFDRHDTAQLYIGSWFNYLQNEIRFYMGLSGKLLFI